MENDTDFLGEFSDYVSGKTVTQNRNIFYEVLNKLKIDLEKFDEDQNYFGLACELNRLIDDEKRKTEKIKNVLLQKQITSLIDTYGEAIRESSGAPKTIRFYDEVAPYGYNAGDSLSKLPEIQTKEPHRKRKVFVETNSQYQLCRKLFGRIEGSTHERSFWKYLLGNSKFCDEPVELPAVIISTGELRSSGLGSCTTIGIKEF